MRSLAPSHPKGWTLEEGNSSISSFCQLMAVSREISGLSLLGPRNKCFWVAGICWWDGSIVLLPPEETSLYGNMHGPGPEARRSDSARQLIWDKLWAATEKSRSEAVGVQGNWYMHNPFFASVLEHWVHFIVNVPYPSLLCRGAKGIHIALHSQ